MEEPFVWLEESSVDDTNEWMTDKKNVSLDGGIGRNALDGEGWKAEVKGAE